MTTPITDTSHFSTLHPPFSPNVHEVYKYKSYIPDWADKVLLLGFTKELLPLATHFVDVSDPPPEYNIQNKKFLKGDWFDIEDHYDVIIGDGVINLTGGKLISHLSDKCEILIIRFFTDKIDGMKYATNFRLNTPFLLPDIVIDTQRSCKLLVWIFNNGY